MTRFKNALADLVRPGTSRSARNPFPGPTAVEKALEPLDLTVARKLELDVPIDEFQAKVLKALIEEGFELLSDRDVRKLPWALWGGARPLSQHPGLLTAYADRFRKADKRSWYSTLRHAYFHSYKPDLPQAEKVIGLLREGQANLKWRWAEPSARYQLFANTKPSGALVAALDGSEPAMTTLESAGFGVGLEFSNYVGHIFKAAAGRRNCVDVAAEDWLWEFCQDEGSLRYPEQAQALVDAFLGPWERTAPPQDRRSTLIKRLLAVLGDPRINRVRWGAVSQARTQQFIQLLNRESIEWFLNIVGQQALAHQWSYRRAFWMSYMNANVISDAWVLFGPAAQEVAQRAFRETNGIQRYGRLNRPSSRDQSVLLLKIGDLTISEFSHNGRVWIWPPESSGTPPIFYRASYVPGQVSGAEVSFVHSNAADLYWQRNVATTIRNYTNIQTPEADWVPRA